MSNRSLGSLTVDLILKMGGFTEGMKGASRQTKASMREIQKAVDESAKRVQKFAAAGAAAMLAGFAMTAALVNSSRQSIDAQAKLARTLDTTTDSITALRMAAGDAGVEGLEQSLAKMNSRLGAVELNGGPALKTVKALKLDMQAMANMDVDQKIGYIGDQINALGISNAEASRHLRQLGFEQEVALELFKSGTANIARYRREVDELGLSLTEIETTKIEQANDALGIFGDITEAFGNRLTAGAASSIKGLAETIEQAWIQTENFGLASQNFEHHFSEAMAKALENTASLLRFMEGRGQMAEFGMIGYLLFGKRGLVIGGAIGALFTAVRKELATLGMLSLAGNAAELAQAEAGIEAAKNALAGLEGRQAHGQNIDREWLVQARILDTWTARARELREIMSEGDWAQFAKHWGEGEDRAEGLAHWAEVAAANIRTARDFVGPVAPSRTTSNMVADPESNEDLDKRLALFAQTEQSLHRQIALFKDQSDMAAMLYDMEHGALAELNPMEKERLWYMQSQLDAMTEEARVSKEREDQIKQQAETIREVGLQAARNMQTHFSDFLFDPFENGLRGMAQGFTDTLRRMVAEAAASKILGMLLGGLANSANPFLAGMGAVFGGTAMVGPMPTRDSGGRGAPGQSYMIGMGAQPEVFVPDTAGTFIPNADRLAAPAPVTIIVHAEDPGAEGRIRAIIQATAPELISAAVGRTVAQLKRPRFA